MSLRDKIRAKLDEVKVTAAGSTEVSVTDSMTSSILDVIKDFLNIADIVPERDEVLKIAGNLFDEYVATRPMFSGRPVLTRLAKQGFLYAVGELYDTLT